MGSLNFSPDAKMYEDKSLSHGNLTAFISDKLNVIIRFHDASKIQQLSHCLLSIFGQSHDFTQPVIVLQGFSFEEEAAVQREVAKWPWDIKHSGATPLIINCENPDKKDLRSKLINMGIQASDGQYFSILDYDDVIYGDAYTYLISRLQKNEKYAISFGNILRTDASPFNGFLYQEKKIAPFFGNDKLDLFVENFCPIHSFVIDRSRAPDNEMYFDEGMSKNEDYHFLVRLLSQSEGDFASRSKIVGEYYVRTDGSNTINSEYSDPSVNKMQDWEKSFSRMSELFESRTTTIPLAEARYMRGKLRELKSGTSSEAAAAQQCITDIQAQLEKKTIELQEKSEAQILQEITLKSILKPLVNAYFSKPSITENVATLHIDNFKNDGEKISLQGWCVHRKTSSSPHQAFLYIAGNFHSVPVSIPRKDVAEHFSSANINGFDISLEANNKSLDNQEILFLAVFLNGEIFMKKIEN